MSQRKQRGFTVVELMVVVVIVGTLAAIAIPIYGKVVKNSIVCEVVDRCNEIVVLAKDWAKANEFDGRVPIWPPASSGNVDMTASEFFTFSYRGGGARADLVPLFVTATGIKGTKMEGVTIEVIVPNINSNTRPATISGL